MKGWMPLLTLAFLVGSFAVEAKVLGSDLGKILPKIPPKSAPPLSPKESRQITPPPIKPKGSRQINPPPIVPKSGKEIILEDSNDIKEEQRESRHGSWFNYWFLPSRVEQLSYTLMGGESLTFDYPSMNRYFGVIATYSAVSPATLDVQCTISVPRTYRCRGGYFKMAFSGLSGKYCGAFGSTQVFNAGSSITLYDFRFWLRMSLSVECTITAVLPDGVTAASTTTAEATTTTTTTAAETTTAAAGDSTTSTASETTTASVTTTASAGCRCGQKNCNTRIVGGTDACLNEYPWQASLVSAGGTQPFCGASIINRQYILTAAHCLDDGTTAGSINVLVGDHTTTGTEASQQSYNVESITLHSGYNSNTYDNDIAIVKLETPIDFPDDNSVAPVCLPSSTAGTFVDDVATVTGWGTTTEGGNQPTTLQEVNVTVISNTACNAAGVYGGSITDNMICAGDVANGGVDSCQGDSGGPLVTSDSSSYVQIGVVSWGTGCARPNKPGVYTRVTEYEDWINSNSEGGVSCTAP